MTKIYSMSAGFLETYMICQDKKNLDPEKIFKRLSFEMGGDGKSITKEQLDNYISDAESGDIKVDKQKLDALKMIQKDWDIISQGKDSITYSDMEKYKVLLFQTMSGGFNVTEIDDSNSSSHSAKSVEEATSSINDAIFDYLTDYLNKSSKSDITESDLNSYLNDLITNDSNGSDSNSELISAVTNLISSYASVSTVETEA